MARSHEELIDDLVHRGYLRTPRIIDAFRAINRAHFVPPALEEDAYVDAPLPIGYGQTISQPMTVAFMLEVLQPEAGEHVLDVGSGSGWKAALLAYVVSQARTIADETQTNADNFRYGHVVSIERIPPLVEMAKENIGKYSFIKKRVVTVLLGDGSKGVPKEYVPDGGFDRIIAGAAAEGAIPESWRNQLKIGGRIVAPVDGYILVLDKNGENQFAEKRYEGFRFVPLIRENH